MANPSLAANTNKFGDLKKRIWFLIGALIVYRIGAHIPVPGINPAELAKLFQSSQTGLVVLADLAILAFGLRSIGLADAALGVDSEARLAQREIRPVPLALHESLAPLQ